MFPNLDQQAGCHKRLKNAHGLLCRAILALAAACPSWFDDMWMTDATPVPCGTSRETVKRSELAGHAGYGYCASYSRYFWGFKLYLVCAGDGMPIMSPDRSCWPTRASPAGNSTSSPRRWGCGCCAPTARTRPTATPTSAASASGSSRSTKPSRPTSPRTPRRAHPGRGLHPRRATPARHGHRHLAQLDHRQPQQTIPDRLRPLTAFTESVI